MQIHTAIYMSIREVFFMNLWQRLWHDRHTKHHRPLQSCCIYLQLRNRKKLDLGSLLLSADTGSRFYLRAGRPFPFSLPFSSMLFSSSSGQKIRNQVSKGSEVQPQNYEVEDRSVTLGRCSDKELASSGSPPHIKGLYYRFCFIARDHLTFRAT